MREAVLLMDKQTEFVFLVFKVKQDEDSRDDILSMLAFSLSATEVLVLPDAYTTVSSAYICRPISGQIIDIEAEEYGSQDSALRYPGFNCEKGGSHIINTNTLFTAF